MMEVHEEAESPRLRSHHAGSIIAQITSPTRSNPFSVPGTPLSQLPESRMNQQNSSHHSRHTQRLPQSPSLPENLSSHLRTEKSSISNINTENDEGIQNIFSTPMSSPQHQHSNITSPFRKANVNPSSPHRNSDIFVRSRIEMFENQVGGPVGPLLNSPLGSPTRISAALSAAVLPSNSSVHHNTSATATATHAALQRAILGREEAETALSSTLMQLQQSTLRERKISERVEELVEDLASVRERQSHERQVFEKEVRKSRKEAFKASSVVVKCQEELKETRTELSRCRATVDRERAEKERVSQEAFERAYTIAGLVEEVAQLKEKVKIADRAKEDNAMQMRVNEVLAIGELEQRMVPMRNMAVQTDNDVHQLAVAHQPRTASAQGDRTAKIAERTAESASDDVLVELKKQLGWLRALRARDEELIDFLQIQCHFQACPAKTSGPQPGSSQQTQYASIPPLARTEHTFEPQSYPNSNVIQDEEDEGTVLVCRASPMEPVDLPPRDQMEQFRLTPESTPLPQSPMVGGMSPEQTALLEDMTQVLVDAAPIGVHGDAKTFSFSTSLSSYHHHPNQGSPSHRRGQTVQVAMTVPDFRRSETATQQRTYQAGSNTATALVDLTATEDDHDNLFNLSPPKTIPPPRPSTALGLTSSPISNSRLHQIQQSPIRIVPNSPKSPLRTIKIPGSRPKSAMSANQSGAGNTPATGTRRLPVRGSDDSGSPVRRSGARERLRLARSPTPAADTQNGDQSVLSHNTPPPPQPVFHREELPSSIEFGARRSPERMLQPFTETTTTTTVPLRGGDRDSGWNGERSYSHTIDISTAGHTGDRDPFSWSHNHNQQHNVPSLSKPPSSRDEGSLTMPLHFPSAAPETDALATATMVIPPATTFSSTVGTTDTIPATPVSRAEALRQIRERRDRARSMQLRAQKGMSFFGGSGAAGGAGGVGMGREVSGMSAPGRM